MDAVTKMGFASFSPFKDNLENVIHSNKITMKSTHTPLMAYPDGDMPTMMLPGKDYTFPNSTKVTERRMQMGGNSGQAPTANPNPIMGKENELLSFHLSKLNKTDQGKFLDIYRGMADGEKEQVLTRIIQDFQGPEDFDMGEMQGSQDPQPTENDMETAKNGKYKCQDGGVIKGGASGYTTNDGRYYEPESPFSMYNQSDNMAPSKGPSAPPLISNKSAVAMADKAQGQIEKIRRDQEGIARIQKNLIGEGYKLPKSTRKKGDLDGVLGVETQKTIDQFVADRTGYNVQTGMTREEAAADAWSTVLAGSGIVSSKFKKFVPLAKIPKAKVVDQAAKENLSNTAQAGAVFSTMGDSKADAAKSIGILDDSKNYKAVKSTISTDEFNNLVVSYRQWAADKKLSELQEALNFSKNTEDEKKALKIVLEERKKNFLNVPEKPEQKREVFDAKKEFDGFKLKPRIQVPNTLNKN